MTAFNARQGLTVGTTPTSVIAADGTISTGMPISGSSLTVTGALSGTSLTGITSTSVVTNLNADKLDGQDGSYYNTAGNLSGTIPSAVLANSTLYVGSTALLLNRATGSLALTGITSIDGSSASCVGNSATATKLAATKNINGTAFDGSADITVGDNITADTATATAVYPVFVTSTGNQGTKINNTAGYFSYIPSTGALTIRSLVLNTSLALAYGGTGGTDAVTARTALDVDQAGSAVSMAIALG